MESISSCSTKPPSPEPSTIAQVGGAEALAHIGAGGEVLKQPIKGFQSSHRGSGGDSLTPGFAPDGLDFHWAAQLPIDQAGGSVWAHAPAALDLKIAFLVGN